MFDASAEAPSVETDGWSTGSNEAGSGAADALASPVPMKPIVAAWERSVTPTQSVPRNSSPAKSRMLTMALNPIMCLPTFSAEVPEERSTVLQGCDSDIVTPLTTIILRRARPINPISPLPNKYTAAGIGTAETVSEVKLPMIV